MKDETQDRYRECFSSAAGKWVLGHLLMEAGFFDSKRTDAEAVALNNFAKKILKNLGLFDITNIDSFVNKIFEIPVKQERKK